MPTSPKRIPQQTIGISHTRIAHLRILTIAAHTHNRVPVKASNQRRRLNINRPITTGSRWPAIESQPSRDWDNVWTKYLVENVKMYLRIPSAEWSAVLHAGTARAQSLLWRAVYLQDVERSPPMAEHQARSCKEGPHAIKTTDHRWQLLGCDWLVPKSTIGACPGWRSGHHLPATETTHNCK